MQTESIGQILLRDTSLTPEQLDSALRLQQTRRPCPELGQILIEKGYISPDQLCHALAQQWNIPYLDTITPQQLKHNSVRKLPLDFLKKQQLLPIIDQNQHLMIAMADPLNIEAYDAVLNILRTYCPRILCPPTEIDKAISRCYYQELGGADQKNHNNNPETDSPTPKDPHEDLLNISGHAPIVKLVNTILFKAINSRASDIHIEPYEQEVKVRYRIDGVLHDNTSLPPDHVAPLISRLKIMANLNIAERRLPQDGQSRIKIGDKELDIRVSIIPISGGERVVLRLLDKGGPDLNMKKLGFADDCMNQFHQLIHSPHGIILLTGPTGSGKTTTLYCAINELNRNECNILTVEDPIEYQLPGVGQMQVKPKINLTFANCLRHILRQDPDVIMIGEIRDVETAEIAIHASLTGHLVFSTLHTNDSASAITRLIDMAIEPYLISSSLTAVMAQRLLRVICPHCKTPCRTEYNISELADYATRQSPWEGQVFIGSGCNQCSHTGYWGRTAIAELLIIDDTIRELIIKRSPAHSIKEQAVSHGMRTLRQDGLRQALTGQTTIEEVLRVTQDCIPVNTTNKENVEI
ncbi:MAG: type II secretion system ATPase GspE [Sedimentisphaerales bacterium]|nr:type II secretion system ATPase GspE [Sedimentisphaerales bacterium]